MWRLKTPATECTLFRCFLPCFRQRLRLGHYSQEHMENSAHWTSSGPMTGTDKGAFQTAHKARLEVFSLSLKFPSSMFYSPLSTEITDKVENKSSLQRPSLTGDSWQETPDRRLQTSEDWKCHLWGWWGQRERGGRESISRCFCLVLYVFSLPCSKPVDTLPGHEHMAATLGSFFS